MPPTPAERSDYLAEAGQHARDAGWVMLDAGRWRCPRCRERWGSDEPRRFTVREAITRNPARRVT